jgi:chromosome segregation ATPase
LAKTIDSALLDRVRENLASGSVTESELRKLSGEAQRWVRGLETQLRTREHRLSRLTADPASSVSDIANELRRVEVCRPRLEELRELVTDLESRAKELRAAWLEAARRS